MAVVCLRHGEEGPVARVLRMLADSGHHIRMREDASTRGTDRDIDDDDDDDEDEDDGRGDRE